MLWKSGDKERKKQKNIERKQNYDRVYQLHKDAMFLCYVDDVYMEEYKGDSYVKLEVMVAIGEGHIGEKYSLYDCKGRYKADVEIEEFYVGADSVDKLCASDSKVVIYPKQQNIVYKAGDVLCKLRRN